ncbi:effector-associated domain EAD1-containing protein [Pseudomonas bubulae]|nr:effector-associated domain EAD1-containing protein [Pseudomonas bubulae]
MQVEQAVYGEIPGRGHGLRAVSPNTNIAVNIASKLDLPDSVPLGVQAWSPFVRGFPIDEHYILARTFLDLSASRGGMVLTHALIVSLDDMCELRSLAGLFGRLATSATDVPDSVVMFELDDTGSSDPPAADLIGVANALAAQGLTPVVRLGVEGFEHLVDSLWRNLWPALRRTFAFRLSFGPNDIVEQPIPMLVCTPEQLQARWAKHSIVKLDDQTPKSESAKILCGQRDPRLVLSLAKDLDLEVHTLRELNRLERLQTLLSGSDSFDGLLAAIRLADGLSIQPSLGASIKNKLIERFTALVPSADCKQLLLMRNLKLSGFFNTEPIWSAVEQLVSNLGFSDADDTNLMEMVATSFVEDIALPSWRAAVTAGLSAAARLDRPAIYQAAWRWVEHSNTSFAAVVGALPADTTTEQRLAKEVPRRIHATSSSALLSPLLKKHWLIAHGAALAATLPPNDATGQQLRVDKDIHHSAGLRSALRYATPSQMLECTLAHRDLRLVEMCAEQAMAHPQILFNICCKDITEQQVWAAALGKDSSLWNAPGDALSVRNTVLAQLAAGQPVDTGLLEILAKTPLADICTTSGRAHLWSLLPASQLDRYLQATATGWLEVAANGAVLNIPEAPLERAIMASSHLRSVLERRATPIDRHLAIINVLPSFSEELFIAWLNNIPLKSAHILPHAASEQLGVLITSRSWEHAAKHLAEKLAHRPDIKPGLRLCADLLSFYTRWRLGISKLSPGEKWKAFEDEARELYPSGPDSDELWSRAGGKNAELQGRSENGRARWHNALISVRSGGSPSARDLLRIMRKDFPMNEKLNLYISDTDIVGWR